MRYLNLLFAGFMLVLIAACGGAGGPDGLLDASGNRLPLSVSVSSPVTVTIGIPQQYGILGGRPAYGVSSTNPRVAVGSVVNDNRLAITGLAAGSATLTVSDQDGKTTNVAVTVTATTPETTLALFVTAPPATTLSVGGGFAQTYVLGGGAGGYSVVSSNTSVATVTMHSAGTMTVTGIAAGTADIVVRDAAGATVTSVFTVTAGAAAPALFTTAPATTTIAVGAAVAQTYVVGGGSGGYTAVSSNTSVATVSMPTATSMRVTGVAAGSADMVVRDAAGATVTSSFVVTGGTAASAPMVLLPSAATASVGDVLSFSVSGGSGSYSSVTVNNASIAAVSSSSTGPFANSLGSSAGVTFFAKLLNVGDTSIGFTDSLGQSATLNLTAISRVASLSLSPGTIQVGEGSSADIALSISGGSAPFSAFTSHARLSSASIPGNVALPTLTVGLGSQGSRCINPVDSEGVYVPYGIVNVTVTVIDSLGASANATLSIQDEGGGLVACSGLTVSPVAATGKAGDTITFTINNGLQAYSVASADPAIATVSASLVAASGGTFSASLVAAGTTTLTIKDSLGAIVRVPLTVVAP